MIEHCHIETPGPGPGGYKGVGEGGAIGAPPAVVNAVADALSPFGVTSPACRSPRPRCSPCSTRPRRGQPDGRASRRSRGGEWPPEMLDALAALTPPPEHQPPGGPRTRAKSHPALEAFAHPPRPGQGLLHVQPPYPVGDARSRPACATSSSCGWLPVGGRRSCGASTPRRPSDAGLTDAGDLCHRVLRPVRRSSTRRGRAAAGGRRAHRRRCHRAGRRGRCSPPVSPRPSWSTSCSPPVATSTVARFTRSIELEADPDLPGPAAARRIAR